MKADRHYSCSRISKINISLDFEKCQRQMKKNFGLGSFSLLKDPSSNYLYEWVHQRPQHAQEKQLNITEITKRADMV